MIGSTFAGLTILERINHGGMADIFLAADAQDRRVILRVLLPEVRTDSRRIRQFKWGCSVLTKLEHPNLIHLIEHGEQAGTLFAVMEFVDGSNLRERILRADPYLKANRMQMLVGMASGLAHIHDHGFLHLDFKPENVLVPHSYFPKLIDFDLAVERPEKPKRIETPAGTPAYWSPEQLNQEPIDERADIFAFGITAYEMLCGKKPITGNSIEEILSKMADLDHNLIPLRQRAPDVPAAVERVVLKCLEKDMSRRYPAMSLVVRDLQK